jgi:manganese/zinc/iron transport system ATP- binding protein
MRSVMAGALVSFHDVAVGYDGTSVLEGLTLEVRTGDCLALLGPNGCGKSTILKTMAGIVPPLRGTVRRSIDGRPVRFGYVPQQETVDLVFPMTTAEMVEMGGYGGLPPGWRAGRAERELALKCLEQVGAADLRGRLFHALSGGQKQRALVARALAAEPELLLLDEPLSGIDAPTAAAIMTLLGRLNRERGLTILLVTHHLGMVREVVREAIRVHAGKLLRGPATAMLAPEHVRAIIEEDFLS